jgi:hypothetical protein
VLFLGNALLSSLLRVVRAFHRLLAAKEGLHSLVALQCLLGMRLWGLLRGLRLWASSQTPFLHLTDNVLDLGGCKPAIFKKERLDGGLHPKQSFGSLYEHYLAKNAQIEVLSLKFVQNFFILQV